MSAVKRSIQQEVRVLNDDRAPTPRSRDRVVQQTALVLGVTTDLVWPQDDHALELPVLCLLYRHGGEVVVVCPVTLAPHRQLAGDNCFDLGASELALAPGPGLMADPGASLTHGPRSWQAFECNERLRHC